MHVAITPSEPGAATAIYYWLRNDPSLAHHAQVRVGQPSNADTMGALEMVDVVLTHAAAAASLTLAFLAWREARPSRGSVTITRDDGQTLTLTAGQAVDGEVLRDFLDSAASQSS
jgi:hypothetical protein